MDSSFSTLAFVALLAVAGVASIVLIVFRSKKQRGGLRRPSVAPTNHADRPR